MDSGAINDALTLITRIISLGKKATVVQYDEAMQLAREAILQQKEMNLDLRDENRQLKEKLAMEQEYVLERSVYWEKSDTEQNQPFCPACYASGKKVPLQRLWEKRDKTQTLWTCPDKKCNSTYNPWDHEEPSGSYSVEAPFY